MCSLYILDINPLSDRQFENIFSQFVGCLFILLMISLAVQKFFSLMMAHFSLMMAHLAVQKVFSLMISLAVQKLFSLMVHLFIFAFVDCPFSIISKKLLPMLGSIYPMFSSRSFMVSGLIFKSLIHFK